MTSEYSIAPRAQKLLAGSGLRNTFGEVLRNVYDATSNPSGGINLAASENHIMTPEVSRFANRVLQTTSKDFTYGEGPWGTLGFRQGMASFMNNYFGPPFQEVKESEILPANGVTGLCQMLAFALFEEGDGILMNRPIYQSFPSDFGLRAEVQIVYATFNGVDQFCKEDCVAGYERALQEAQANGIRVRAMMLCNPHNPLGQCYTKEAIIELMKFCDRHKLHLLSDEIYALSVYDVPDPHAVPFTSVLGFDNSSYIQSDYLHVLYGFSKDFASGGLRLAILHSRNEELMRVMETFVQFHWTGSLDSIVAQRMVEDREWLDSYLALSRSRLSHCNKLCRNYLDEKGIKYHLGANAGFFMWIDLRPFLQFKDSQDGWEAEDALQAKFWERKVFLNNGKSLNSEEPGWFRLIFSQEEEMLKEGIKRIFEVLHV